MLKVWWAKGTRQLVESPGGHHLVRDEQLRCNKYQKWNRTRKVKRKSRWCFQKILRVNYKYLSSTQYFVILNRLVKILISDKSYFNNLLFRVPVQKTRPCIADFLESSRHCLESKDKQGINVTMKMIDAAIDFVCYNSGDRIARE